MHRHMLSVSAAMLPLSHTPRRGEWTNGIPRYQAIHPTQYCPAFDTALKAERAASRAITVALPAPNFATTIVAMERSGQPLARISWA